MVASVLTRRAFLASASASALVAAMPIQTVPTVAANAAPAAEPVLKAFVVGTPGEFDWRNYFARSAEEAFSHWRWEQYGGDDDEDAPVFDPDYVHRIPQWDGRSPKGITPVDWLEADLGYCCERCGYESHAETGARAVAGEVVCAECLTFADRAICDPDDLVEELADLVAGDEGGAADVRGMLETRGQWDAVKNLWPRVLAEAGAA